MLITENHFHYLIILRYMSRISIHICTLIGNRIKSFIYSVFLLIWQSYSSKNSASRRISDKFLSNIFCQINLYHCLHYRFPIHYNFPDSRLFFPVKIKAKHISFIHMIIFQISNKLLFSSLIIFITMPYLQFNYILLSTIIYNYICSSKISCSGKRSKSFLPEIPFRYFTIAVMDNFGGADTKQCTWSPSPHSNRWTVKPLSSAISCTSSCRYASTSAFNIFRRYFTDHTI